MVADVSCKDTVPLPASSVNSPANSLVPEFSAPVTPLFATLTRSLVSADSKGLTANLSPLFATLTKTPGVGVPLFVTSLELPPSMFPLNSHRITFLRAPRTKRPAQNRRIPCSFISLRTLAENKGGWHLIALRLSRRRLAEGRPRILRGRTFRSDIKNHKKKQLPQFCASVLSLDACADSVGSQLSAVR